MNSEKEVLSPRQHDERVASISDAERLAQALLYFVTIGKILLEVREVTQRDEK